MAMTLILRARIKYYVCEFNIMYVELILRARI